MHLNRSGKFLVLWQKYLPSAVNGLKNGPKVSDLTKETFSSSAYLRMIKKEDKSAIFETSAVFETLSHIDCPRIFQNTICYAFK